MSDEELIGIKILRIGEGAGCRSYSFIRNNGKKLLILFGKMTLILFGETPPHRLIWLTPMHKFSDKFPKFKFISNSNFYCPTFMRSAQELQLLIFYVPKFSSWFCVFFSVTPRWSVLCKMVVFGDCCTASFHRSSPLCCVSLFEQLQQQKQHKCSVLRWPTTCGWWREAAEKEEWRQQCLRHTSTVWWRYCFIWIAFKFKTREKVSVAFCPGNYNY